MRATTHFAIGLACGVGLSIATGQTQPAPVMLTVGLTGVAALLPDMDIKNSTINRMLLPKQFKAVQGFFLYILAACLILGYFLIDSSPAWVLLLGLYILGAAIFGHRSFTHSLLALLYIGLTSILISPTYSSAVMIGYGSHILADACTKKGVPLFWPFLRKNFSLSQLGIIVRTNGTVDHLLGLLSFVIAGVGLAFYILF
jgi:inner membrane protein